MLTFNVILENYEDYSEVQDFARGFVWCEEGITEQNIGYKRHEETIEGIEIWYDYGADYYFFAPEDETEWADNIEEKV